MKLLTIDIHSVTLADYLKCASNAAANGADKPFFRQLNSELIEYPETRIRLAWEALAALEEDLDWHARFGSKNLWSVLIWVTAIPPARRREFARRLKAVVDKILQRVEEGAKPGQIEMKLLPLLASIRNADPTQFDQYIAELRIRCVESRRLEPLLPRLKTFFNPSRGR